MPANLLKDKLFTGKDFSGLRFGRLTVSSFAGRSYSPSKPHGIVKWKCVCDCGCETVVSGRSLTSGRTISCGCFHKEQLSKRVKTHGQSKTVLYRRWAGMLTRCTNPNRDFWDRYGGRSIEVCERWRNYEAFAYDMGETFSPELTIERRDNDLGYCKENCYWGTPLQQANNTSKNKVVEFSGRKQTVANWARETGINPFTLYYRLKSGWDVTRALTTKARG
jgi:hypothetical protein